jgi:hypothetical protein
MEINVVVQQLANWIQQAWQQRKTSERFAVSVRPEGETGGRRVFLFTNHLRSLTIQHIRQRVLQDGHFIPVQKLRKEQVT